MAERKVSRVEEQLESLVRTGSSGGHWPSASEIRQRSVRRHRRRVGAGGSAAVVLVIVIAVTSVAIIGPGRPGGNPTEPRVTNYPGVSNHIGSAVELTSLVQQTRTLNSAAEAKVANAEEEFSLKILGQLVTQSSSANQLVSPFSLSEALAMTLLGARGQTATQIAQALGLSKLSTSEQALGWASLDDDLVGVATHDHIALKDANSVWTQKGFPIEPGFLNNLKSEFGAGVWQTDFDHDPAAAVRSVNAWVSQETDGQIPSLLQPSDVPQSTVAVLLNAVLFEAQWDAQLTDMSSGVFHAPGGDVSATYMSPSVGDSDYLSSFGPDLDAVQLAYWNGTGQHGNRPPSRYAALLLMPTSGSLGQFVGSLDVASLNGIIGGMSNQAVDPLVPESKISSSLQLAPPLQELGITDAFGPGADFSGLSTIATQISEVKQQATLSITKWGTVASAATAVVNTATALRETRSLMFNRPFLFMIRDTKTGAILFESAINNPADEG